MRACFCRFFLFPAKTLPAYIFYYESKSLNVKMRITKPFILFYYVQFYNFKYNKQKYKAANFLYLLLYILFLFFHLLSEKICRRRHKLQLRLRCGGSFSVTKIYNAAADISGRNY